MMRASLIGLPRRSAYDTGAAGIKRWYERLLLNQPPPWMNVPLALGIVAVATVARLLMVPFVTGGQFPTFFLAVIIATLVGGIPAGALSIVFSAASAYYFLLQSSFALDIYDPGEWMALVLFVLVAGLMVSVTGALRSAIATAGESRRQAIELGARARVADEIRLWSEAFQNAAFAITVTDTTTLTIRLANESAAAVHGMRVEQMQGMKISDLYAPAERTRLTALRAQADATGHVDFEADRRRADGSTFPARVHISSVRGSDGQVLYHVGTVRDITFERRAAAELDQSRRLQAVGQLTAGVARDFNNLLQAIMGHLELATDDRATLPATSERIAAAIRLAENAGDLTRQLLSFSGKQLLIPTALDLPEFFRSFGIVMMRALKSRIRIQMQVEPDLPVLWIDPSHLQSALLNLAINAKDAMPTGGDLRLQVSHVVPDAGHSAARHLIVIRVSDSGEGIAPENLEKVCEPFFTTKGVNGSGLGLSMVYGFVSQSGGDLRITSKVGQGTTVELSLPTEPMKSLLTSRSHAAQNS